MDYTNLVLFGAGVLGILIHNLTKINQINRRESGNFSFRNYIRLEWASIAISFCVIIVALIAKHEVKQLEQAKNYLALFFTFTGYASQSLVVSVFGRAEKSLKND